MFKPVNTNAIDIKKDQGAKVGTYMGKSDITTKIGPQVIWNFADEEGMPFGIFGFTNLNNAMHTIKEGLLCRITYQGTKFVKTKFKPAGQDVHQVLVEVDTDTDEEAPIEATQ